MRCVLVHMATARGQRRSRCSDAVSRRVGAARKQTYSFVITAVSFGPPIAKEIVDTAHTYAADHDACCCYSS